MKPSDRYCRMEGVSSVVPAAGSAERPQSLMYRSNVDLSESSVLAFVASPSTIVSHPHRQEGKDHAATRARHVAVARRSGAVGPFDVPAVHICGHSYDRRHDGR